MVGKDPESLFKETGSRWWLTVGPGFVLCAPYQVRKASRDELHAADGGMDVILDMMKHRDGLRTRKQMNFLDARDPAGVMEEREPGPRSEERGTIGEQPPGASPTAGGTAADSTAVEEARWDDSENRSGTKRANLY